MNSTPVIVPARSKRLAATIGATGILALALTASGAGAAHAADATLGLGSATSYAVLAATTVSNTGPTVVNGNVGLYPGTAVDGFSVGNGTVVPPGEIHAADPEALQAKADVRNAYRDAASRANKQNIDVEMGGVTFTPGIYTGAVLEVNGIIPVTLDAEGDPDAVFVFRGTSTLTTGTDSVIQLINGANACNVFWRVPSSAELGVNSTFVGTILASTSVSALTGADIEGRLLALTGAVTLDTNTINAGNCAEVASTPAPIADDGDDDTGGNDGDNSGGGGDGAAGGDNDSTAGGAELAATGDEHTLQIIAALAALTGGAALLIFGPRRRNGAHASRRDATTWRH